MTLDPGDIARFECVQLFADGTPSYSPSAVVGATDDPAVAVQSGDTKDGSGIAIYVKFLATGPGTTQVRCALRDDPGKFATATVTVRPYAVELSPSSVTLIKDGVPGLLSISVKKPDGSIPSVGPQGLVQLKWTTDNDAAVNLQDAPENGKYAFGKAVTEGTKVTVKALLYGATVTAGIGTATVRVVAASSGLTVTTGSPSFSVTSGSAVVIPFEVKDANGSPVPNAAVTFTVTGPCVVLSSTSGSVVVRGTSAGACDVTITATYAGSTGSKTVPVTVTDPPPTAATLVGAGTGTAVGGTRQLIGINPTGDLHVFAAALSATAPRSPGYAITPGFSSSNTAVATVSATGLITGVSAGTTTITGQWSDGGVDYRATLSEPVGPLDPAMPQSISLSTLPGLSTTVRVGKVTAYGCSATNASGANIVANTVWTSSNTSVATVSSAGVVTGVAAGTATITCNINGRTTTMSTTVTP